MKGSRNTSVLARWVGVVLLGVALVTASVSAPAQATGQLPLGVGAVVAAGPPAAACGAMKELARSKKVQQLDRAMLRGGKGAAVAYRRAVPALRHWLRTHRADLPVRPRRAVAAMIDAGDQGRLTVPRIESLARPLAVFMLQRCGILA